MFVEPEKGDFDDFKFQPDKMFHVGDGCSDVVGAKHGGADARGADRSVVYRS